MIYNIKGDNMNIGDTFLEIFSYTWPMIFIFTIILVSARVSYVILKKEKIVLHKELLTLLAVIYLLCLFYVVTFQDVSWASSNFVPFKEIFRYSFGSRLFFKNVLGNMIMFLPYGFFLGYYLNNGKYKIVFYLSVLVSFTIEIIQYKIGRVFDIDDVLLNICGAFFGFYLYKLSKAVYYKLPKLLKNKVFLDIIVLLMIIGAILFLIKLF